MTPAEARVHGDLLLRVGDDADRRDGLAQRGLETAEGLAEGAVEAAGAARVGTLDDVELLRGGRPGGHYLNTTRTIAVTSTLSVASGSSTFQPRDMSWS